MSTSLSLSMLPEKEARDVRSLLKDEELSSLTIEEIWKIMDSAWDKLECDKSHLDWAKIGLFYQHPVWLLNGLFSEQDEISLQYRCEIAKWIGLNRGEIASVVDYGGGFGTVARLLAERENDLIVDIYEPYANNFAIERLKQFSNVQFVSSLNKQYDCLVSLDVLEHVEDPLKLFSEMINTVRVGGYLIIANHFHPVIKCHLPVTFHLRYTFNYFAGLMGLKTLGSCERSHAFLYKKSSDSPLDWKKIRMAEKISKLLFPLLSKIYPVYQNLKQKFR
jgi:2-polyprenyl-3-methyl-5-hydroxy-6-metoxy-1,4-benzoquinol methylase